MSNVLQLPILLIIYFQIRSSVYLLLTRFYRLPLQNNVSTAEDLCCHLVTEALRLCNSPKGQEGQTGAVLCKLIFQK
ncbi:hypothetical protein DPMN_090245 [Dreissena polymorpha]|uniref:Uncharacterized protein n=1 Tax=Dreissena polymorpha TaxID=45954 RepID=A0A9D4KXD1_DREPO|nr:hypothetical protein DPMN_090245 [Dreissena polymorpha]